MTVASIAPGPELYMGPLVRSVGNENQSRLTALVYNTTDETFEQVGLAEVQWDPDCTEWAPEPIESKIIGKFACRTERWCVTAQSGVLV